MGKHKESTKDLNKSWTQAIWGLENVSEKIAEENANSVVGVGDGQSDRKTRRGGREGRSQDKECTPEHKRSNSNSRELENKKVDKDADADLVLEQLRRNKPRSATRQRSESTDNSKQRRNQGRSRSPQPQKDNVRQSRDKIRKNDPKETTAREGKVIRSKDVPSKHQSNEENYSPKRTRFREKIGVGEIIDTQGEKSYEAKNEKSVMPRITRASSKDKYRTAADSSKDKYITAADSSKDKRGSRGKEDHENNVPTVNLKSTESKQSSVEEKQLKDISSEKFSASQEGSNQKGLAYSSRLGEDNSKAGFKEMKEVLESKNTNESKSDGGNSSSKDDRRKKVQAQIGSMDEDAVGDNSQSKEKKTKPVSSPTKRNFPNILKRSPIKSRATILGEIEVTTRPPVLDINLLAEKSAQILSSLSSLENNKRPTEPEDPPGLNVGPSEENLSSSHVISRSPFFVFLNQLPFGMFEEDLQ